MCVVFFIFILAVSLFFQLCIKIVIFAKTACLLFSKRLVYIYKNLKAISGLYMLKGLFFPPNINWFKM